MAQQSSQRRAFVTPMGPGSRAKSEVELQELDTNPSDKQPPGVDEETDYNSLEEALTG